MFRWFRRRRTRPPSAQRKRRLLAEPLEPRRLLNGDWSGTLIHDSTGDIFAIDLNEPISVEYLGTTTAVMFDMAFSPTGQLYGVGGPLSGPSELYEIQIDFSGPTPSVETHFVGTITMGGLGIYVNSLEFSPDGTLFAAGYDAFGQNALFEISLDTAGAVREIHLDFYQSSGDMEFDEFGNLYLTTLTGDLLRLDVRNDTYQWVGSTFFTDFFGLTYGAAPVLYGFRQNREVYRIDPNTGAISPTPAAVLVHPQLDWVWGAATVFPAPTNLGQVDFAELTDQQTILGQRWYRLETVREALFSVDLPGAHNVDIQLYRRLGDGTLEQLEAEEVRLDYAASANTEYYVQIENAPEQLDVLLANLFQLAGNGAVVYGTEGNDVFELTAGPPYVATINGVSYQYNFSPDSPVNISFDGGVGRDEAHITGTPLADTAELSLLTHSGTVESSAYQLSVSGTPIMSFDGGGGLDTVSLTGSSGDDTVTIRPQEAHLAAGVASLDATAARTLHIDTAGGDDSTTFTGTAIDETVILQPLEGQFQSGSFTATVTGSEHLLADAGAGNDTITLLGGPGADLLESWPDHLTYTGPSLDLAGIGFETVTATGNAAEGDAARLYGKGGALETFTAERGLATLSGGGLWRQVTGFRNVDAYGNSYEADVATLVGDPSVPENFYATSYYGMLSAPGYYNRAAGFRQVTAKGSPDDSAKFYDSADNDTLQGSPTTARMIYGNQADYFRQADDFGSVFAYATTAGSGFDVAELSDLPGQRDVFIARTTGTTFFGPGYRYWLSDFEQIGATASDPLDGDVAYICDTDGNDTFTFISDPSSPSEHTQLSGVASNGQPFTFRADGFARTVAYAFSGGLDTAYFYDSSTSLDRFWGTDSYSVMVAAGRYGRAVQFEQVYAYADPGDGFGDDARLFDSAGNDTYEGRSTSGKISYNGSVNHFVKVTGFRYVTAYATAGGNDQAMLYGMVGTFDKLWASLDTRYALRYNNLYYHRADQFETVVAFGDPGEADAAYVFDSTGDDLLTANGLTNPWKATVASVDQVIETWDFRYVRADSSAGGTDSRDVQHRDLLDFVLYDTGAWTDL